MSTDLLRIARALPPNAAYEAYKTAKALPNEGQWCSALEIASPQIKMRYANEFPTPGKMLTQRTPDATGRIITTYAGDSRTWRSQFEVNGIPCIMSRPR